MCSETVAAENVDEDFKIKTLMLWGSEFGLTVGFFPISFSLNLCCSYGSH